MKTPDRELRRLVDAWHDGTISREDGLRLEQRLEDDPAAARYWLEISAIEAALPAVLPDVSPATARRPTWRLLETPWLRVAAIFLLGLFFGGLVWRPVKPWPDSVDPVAVNPPSVPGAVITGMLGIRWDQDSPPPGVAIAAGERETSFSSGLMELTFASGTRTVVEGPAEFRILGPNSMSLTHGKIVANVPKGAEGFAVNHRDGQVVDLGTEFAIDAPRDGSLATLGVFRGKIEFHPRDAQGEVLHLGENQALLASATGGESVPFRRSDFHRELPSREFTWELTGPSAETATLEFDVSHLVWKPGRYRVVCKWMSGRDGADLQGAELLRDGERVSNDPRPGFAGAVHGKPGNIFELKIPEGTALAGRWVLRLRVSAHTDQHARPADSHGLVLFEEGMATTATTADFAGTWEYLFNGRTYRRTYYPDGRAELVTKEGSALTFQAARWRVEDGVMVLDVPEEGGIRVSETHLLRDAQTLIFANQPYQNATRVASTPVR
jgi:hypothetical protein